MTHVVVQGSQADEMIADRRTRGIDTYDEVRAGVYYVVPAGSAAHGRYQARLIALLEEVLTQGYVVTGPINVGQATDYRVPDCAVIAGDAYDDATVWFEAAVLVGEVLSPGDEYIDKLGHYWRLDVEEIVVVDPTAHVVEIGRRDPHVRGRYAPAHRCELAGLSGQEIAARIGL